MDNFKICIIINSIFFLLCIFLAENTFQQITLFVMDVAMMIAVELLNKKRSK